MVGIPLAHGTIREVVRIRLVAVVGSALHCSDFAHSKICRLKDVNVQDPHYRSSSVSWVADNLPINRICENKSEKLMPCQLRSESVSCCNIQVCKVTCKIV